MPQSIIQKLTSSGYKIEDIHELILIFKQNLHSIHDELNVKNNTLPLDLIHKLKGGLKVLLLTEELPAIELLERKVQQDGIDLHINAVNLLIKEYHNILEKALAELRSHPLPNQ